MYIQVKQLRHKTPATTVSSTCTEKQTTVQIPKVVSATCNFASAGCARWRRRLSSFCSPSPLHYFRKRQAEREQNSQHSSKLPI